MNREYIKETVNKLKKKYKTDNPKTIAYSENIEVIYCPLDIWGMYKYIKRNKVIFVNSCLTESEQHFVLIHEIGHAILHPKSNCFFSNATNYLNKVKIEYEANVFLAEFSIYDIDESELNGYSINQIASKFNVPVEIVKLKFNYI